MTTEELKAILEEVPNDCEVKIVDHKDLIMEVKTVRYRRTFKKDGSIEELHIIA